MGLIYVNPKDPTVNQTPSLQQMISGKVSPGWPMNDEETVALNCLVAMPFGKTHGAGDPKYVGPEPEPLL
jgi:catalase-peroxidase